METSGEITAIATAVLAVFAIVTAFYARQAFRKQSQEVSAIERQVKDQQELAQQQAELLRVQSGQLELQRRQFDDQITERHRAQACRVFIWTETGPEHRLTEEQIQEFVPSRDVVTAYVRNTSEQPVYDLVVTWYKETGQWWAGPERLPVLMPGEQTDSTRAFQSSTGEAVLPFPFEVAARFRDAAGVYWRIGPDGQLGEEPVNAYTAGNPGLPRLSAPRPARSL